MFRTVNGTEVDPVEYVRKYIREHEGIQLFIGCDSQNYGRVTVYATAIVLYTPGKGGHVIYEKERVPREKASAVRLINEVWKSVSLANSLKDAGIQSPEFIDIDINPSKRYKSNEVFASAVGIVEGCGYKCRYKTLGPVSTWCADALVRS